MKRRVNFWAAALAATMLLGCGGFEQPSEEEKNYGEIHNVTLDVKFQLDGAQSKSQTEIDDQIIENINLYVTDEEGKTIYQNYYSSLEEINIDTYDNMHYCIYAIANAGKKIQAQNREEIESLTYSIGEISEIKSNSGAILMSGKTGPQLLNTNLQVTIVLTRCVAKIRLKANYSELYEDVNIKVNSIQLKNAPQQTSIFKENKISDPSNSIDGEIISSPEETELGNGIDFYQFENMQGTLLPQNTNQQEKQWPQESIYNKLCSYIELNATYSSPRKYGEILYRFYLGNDMLTNFDIKRNTQLNITVNFKNDGAVEENTWRVDNSYIMDLVTGIELSTSSLHFSQLGETKHIDAQILPPTAYNKEVKWNSTNTAIAMVDTEGNVTSTGNGECKITATSKDGSNITATCYIIVNQSILEYKPIFKTPTLNSYNGKMSLIEFTQTATGEITATSSNNSIVKIKETNSNGVIIEALAPGEATITAGTGTETTTKCTVKVEKLKIIPENNNYTMYNHFYEDIEYSIEPSWAAQEFDIEFLPDKNELNCGFEGLANRVIPQFGAEQSLPEKTKITLKLSGREDVFADVMVTVKPMLSLASSMQINANWGNTDAVRDLGLETSPRGNVTLSWVPADGVKYYGNPGNGNVQISKETNKIIFPIPNSANGLYRLKASVTGDDGYGENEGAPGAEQYCNITIYETIYLVGISKTIDRNRVGGETDTWEYENEVVGKWFSHPNSLLYSPGELDMELSFSYKGETFNDSYTGKTEIFRFTFEKGELLQMALDAEPIIYNGTPPAYYLEYFYLEPAGSAYIDGSPATGAPYLYICSRNFTSGFSNQSSPDWKKIFEYIYP